jgi:hypothetical protein
VLHLIFGFGRAASEQKALFEPSQEGERALHFLETLQPGKLFEELHTLGIAAVVGLLAEVRRRSDRRL